MTSNRSFSGGFFAAALLLLSAVLWLLLGPNETEETALVSPSHEGSQAPSTRLGEPLSLPSPEPVSQVSLPPSTATMEAPDARAEVSGSKKSAPIVASGKLVITELDGSLTKNASGTLDLTVWHGNSGLGADVEVMDGQWILRYEGELMEDLQEDELTLEQCEKSIQFEPEHFQPSGSEAYAKREGKPVKFAWGNRDVPITFFRIAPIHLNVIDAITRAPLDNVEVRSLVSSQVKYQSHPGGTRKSSILASELTSPLSIYPGEQEMRTVFVSLAIGSPGYAWTAQRVDFSQGETYDIALQAGGDLEVFLSGESNAPEARIRLVRNDHWAAHSSMGTRRGGPYIFQGLEPGTYHVSLEIGDNFGESIVLGGDTVEIAAGQFEALTLEVKEAPKYQAARFAGTLHLPQEWELQSPFLRFNFLGTALNGKTDHHYLSSDEVKPVPGKPGQFSFDFEDVQIGEYELQLANLRHTVMVTVTEVGDANYSFEIPPPVGITVHVIDSSTGQVADIPTLSWANNLGDGQTGGSYDSASRKPEEPAFSMRVPLGKISLRIGGDEYQVKREVIDAKNGSNHVIQVNRSAQVTITLMHGEERVPWSGDFFDVVVPVDGEGYVNHLRGNVLGVSEEGRYRIFIPKTKGYEDHEPVEFEMVFGQNLQLVIEMTPDA